jgi:hypothetical protein
MLYSQSSQNPVPKGFKLPHDQQKYDGSQEPQSWLSDYLQVVRILGGLERDNNADPAATPHWRGAVMVRQARERNNWKLGRTQKAVYKQLQFDLHATSVNGRSQSLHAKAQRITSVIHTTMEHHQKLRNRCF